MEMVLVLVLVVGLLFLGYDIWKMRNFDWEENDRRHPPPDRPDTDRMV